MNHEALNPEMIEIVNDKKERHKTYEDETRIMIAGDYRCRENGVLFVWYDCSRKDCDGQWLQKTSPIIFNSL